MPVISPDARQRRLAALLKAAVFERTTPTLFVIEDVHWIDEASESMLGEFIAAVPLMPSTRSLVLITHRPEYRGALSRASDIQTINLAPLTAVQTVALATTMLGTHPSVTWLAAHVAERAAGNPFFADEIVRDLAERGVLTGDRGALYLPGQKRRPPRAGHTAGRYRRPYRPPRRACQTCAIRRRRHRCPVQSRSADRRPARDR